MFRLVFIALFLVSCTKPSPAPQKWNDWVEAKKASFQKKISTPAAVQFLYLPKDAPTFFLGKDARGYSISKTDFKNNSTAYKLDFKTKSLLNAEGAEISGESESHQVNHHIFMRVVFMTTDSEEKARVFLYDLNKKNLAQKRKRSFFRYTTDQKYSSTYEKFSTVKTAKFQRSDGTTRDFNILGTLKIENGSSFSVYAESDQKEKAVMLMFRDKTNGESTYGAGRYLYVDLEKPPGEMLSGDQVELDFNYTFNPPCAVSKGFHCPLPQDLASFHIKAGEKYIN